MAQIGNPQSGNAHQIPDGIRIIADLGTGIKVAYVPIEKLNEQEKNARIMKPEMFKQLVANIKNRGTLESLPYCVLTDKIEVVSGHHRTRASREAGLKEIPVLLDISELNRSNIAAKQLAHNAISGTDDENMLKEIAKIITDVDDMLESYIAGDLLDKPLVQLDKLLSPKMDFDWRSVTFLFLPYQIDNFNEMCESIAGEQDIVAIALKEQFEPFMKALQAWKDFNNIKSIGTAINLMIEVINERLQNAGYDESQSSGYTSITNLLGGAAIEKESAENVKKAIALMEKNGEIPPKAGVRAIECWALKYLMEEGK